MFSLMITHFDSPQAAMSSPEQLQRWGGLGGEGEQECTQIHFLLQSGKRDDYVVNPHLTSERLSWVQNICYQIFITINYFPRLNYCKTHLPLEGITTGLFCILESVLVNEMVPFDIETSCKHFLKLNQQMNFFFFNLKWKFLLCHSADQ